MYYGWLIVALVMLSALLGAGLNNVSMAVVLKPVSEDQQWSRTLTSGAITVGALLAGALAPSVGRLADRIGPRVLMPVGAGIVGTLALLLGSASAPWHFYAAYVPARALADTLLCGVVPMTAVTNWFHVKRPRAIGLVFMSVPLGSAGLALLYQALIAEWGWRAAFLALGLLLWTLAVLPAALLLRRQPEDLGLLPDGAAPAAASPNVAMKVPHPGSDASEVSWRVHEALRTRAIWLIVLSSFLATLATGGTAFHLVAYFTDVGIPPGAAAGALGLMALAGAGGGGLWGTLSERVAPRYLCTAVLAISAVAVLLLLQVRAAWMAYVGALLFGVAGRGGLVFTHVLVARYYGRRSFGAISGYVEPFGKLGLGGGPLVAGAAFDLAGNYQGVFLVFASLYVLAASLICFAGAPARRPGATASH
jgi:MFS family permease